jgi:hypothetical protein
VSSILLLSTTRPSAADGLIDELIQRFAQSDFQFQRVASDIPFLPVAWLTATTYGNAQFVRPDGGIAGVDYHQTSLSEGGLLPVPLGVRDAVAIGEWLSSTDFRLEHTSRPNVSVLSVSVPLGWLRQQCQTWQIAAFVAPLGSTDHNNGWYWETLGGAFARHAQTDHLSWVFGAFFDVAPQDHFYAPYVGLSYALDEHWTFDVLLPWPGVTFAPNKNYLLRLGISPAGASWSVDKDEQRPHVSLSVWNLGLHAEHRLFKQIWLSVEAGVSGLRGLSVEGGAVQPLNTHLSNTGYALLGINLRPAAVR